MTLFLAAIADSEEMVNLHFVVGIYFLAGRGTGKPSFCFYMFAYTGVYIYDSLLLSILVPVVSTATS